MFYRILYSKRFYTLQSQGERQQWKTPARTKTKQIQSDLHILNYLQSKPSYCVKL